MKGRSVTIHQNHGGGEVETAGGQYPDGGPGIERFAGHHSRWIKIETAARQH